MQYTLYDAATGEILQWGDNSNPDLELEDAQGNIRTDIGILKGVHGHSDTQRVDVVTKQLYDFARIKSTKELLADISNERQRRQALGFDYNFNDERGIHHIGTTEDDMKGWSEVTMLKDLLFQSSDDTTKITIETNTGIVDITGPEWSSILLYAAMDFRQPLWKCSMLLAAQDPIPQDIANDAYWQLV